MAKHKIGGHVLGEQRVGWGKVAPRFVCCVSLQTGAFDELPDEAIKVFRTQAEPDHVDVAGDFDRLEDDRLFPAGEWWWGKLKKHYEPVKKKYKNVYFQPTNEINNKRLAPYMQGMMQAAAKDSYRLALFGDAGDSPSWDDWVKHWVPVLREGAALGHIYCRHAYSGVDRSQNPLTHYLTD